jgi:formate dehydrogenase major subunit
MTNHWIDLRNSDCLLIMGSNAAENHPISMKWIMKAKENGGKILSVDPRFTRTTQPSQILAEWLRHKPTPPDQDRKQA